MKTLFIILLISVLSSSATLVAQTTNKKDPIELCSELSGFIRTLATERDSGIDYQNSEAAESLKQSDETSKIKSTQILKLVKQTSKLKPNVLSNALGSACMHKENVNMLNSDHYSKFEVCNSYHENEELVFKCVTNLTD